MNELQSTDIFSLLKIVKVLSLSVDFVIAGADVTDIVAGTLWTALAQPKCCAVRCLSEPVAGPAGGELRRSCVLRSRASHRRWLPAIKTVSSTSRRRRRRRVIASRQPHRHRDVAAASQPSERTPPLRYWGTLFFQRRYRPSMPKTTIILRRRSNAKTCVIILLRPRTAARHAIFQVPVAAMPSMTPLNSAPDDGSIERLIVIDWIEHRQFSAAVCVSE